MVSGIFGSNKTEDRVAPTARTVTVGPTNRTKVSLTRHENGVSEVRPTKRPASREGVEPYPRKSKKSRVDSGGFGSSILDEGDSGKSVHTSDEGKRESTHGHPTWTWFPSLT